MPGDARGPFGAKSKTAPKNRHKPKSDSSRVLLPQPVLLAGQSHFRHSPAENR
jgi:hypothetical protein